MRLPTYNIPQIISCVDIGLDYIALPRCCEDAIKEDLFIHMVVIAKSIIWYGKRQCDKSKRWHRRGRNDRLLMIVTGIVHKYLVACRKIPSRNPIRYQESFQCARNN